MCLFWFFKDIPLLCLKKVFLALLQSKYLFFHKVKVSKEGTVAEYGMLATDDIEEGEVLFTIPRAALLHQGTSEVSSLLEKGDD